MCREDTKLPENLGGLNIPDIEKFCTAFKFSWLCRALTSNSFWPKILSAQILISFGSNYQPCDLLKLGTALLVLGKKFTNKCWCQVLNSTLQLTDRFIFSYPEKLTFSSFWYKPLIKQSNKTCRFPSTSCKHFMSG